MKKIKRALISVSDKKDLKPLLSVLKKFKVEIISSGGTYKEIKKLRYACTEVSDYTGSPEILGGRVKTLHPKIHAGILNKRNNKSHHQDLIDNNFDNIDLVIVNFYPFEQTLENTSNHKKIIENIDVGGPTMVRAAAKNYNDVTVITSNSQYEELINELTRLNGSTSLEFRQKMSRTAFTETAYYDALISNYFNKITNNHFPEKKIISGNLVEKLRYGENPHQESAIYSKNKTLDIIQLHGKQLSYNNYNDIFAALTISKSLPKNTGVVIIKHANPCGVSALKDPVKCYKSALACDPVSAFGGIVSCNFKINKKLALELQKLFLEVIIGDNFDAEALRILKKKKNLRLIDASNFHSSEILKFISANQNILIQSEDSKIFSKKDFAVVSKKKPTKSQFDDLIFALNVCRFVKSNAIVLSSNKTTVGIGSGQPSRLDSCQIAINKMKKFTNPSTDIVAASDAFFPFVDGIEKLIQSGVKAVIQPSGSINDKEIIKFANETNTVLIFSKTRHFRH
ncbi:bifunctional phosphoribosylaminoimidazolecarboxamide formyltransferase/IMP cyclohydrolase [Candidatus Pelagibacter sp. HIMB1321]|uniref:bifunctional phosphoribosylaminoimidazolecarboxamide formyltransferase/IMP cyclohydrolase n=1 Tax=Candidatus Pelagibacter sp. HIMB1321 TaxID=1388755 RepID=UPI000A0818D5|nr:bifunctional phosphoribosylaminoimidazolecarboxamide formyltransferase/IMP cyclohydrolase [Candidatus Pelagibacter sp. HIMB1321]SMF80876.1 phosphoribosylaminoimidazolecarboxamide formyltransferase / IMP cyclohydrolase [Candidatus Pelagibacter sp. HIMB1321]